MCGGVCYPSEEFRCSPQAAAASPLLTSPRTAELSGLCAPLWEATLGGRGWSAWLLLFVEKLLKWVRQKGRLLLLQPWGSAVLSGAFLAYCLVLHLRSGRGGGSPRETLRRRLEPQGLFQGAGGSPSRRAPRGAGERSPRRATELCGGPGARGARRRICPAERREECAGWRPAAGCVCPGWCAQRGEGSGGAGILVPGPRQPAPASVTRPGLGRAVMERGGTLASAV